MKIEDQCCTLEQAKRLNELGVVQESLFYWVTRSAQSGKHTRHETFISNRPNLNYKKSFPAFTVAELGVMLPSGYDTLFVGAENGWRGYDDSSMDCPHFNCLYKTEAEARAAMLIHLLENKLITPEEVNKRLQS